MADDRSTFRFQVNRRPGQAYCIDLHHVGLVLPAEGLTSSAILEVDEAKALCAALQSAIAYAENVWLGESAVDVGAAP